MQERTMAHAQGTLDLLDDVINVYRGFAGENCTECATNFGPPGQCYGCVPRWGGEMCDSCAPGWTGPDCDVCDGFGFSEESNCTECIQNGLWAGLYGASYAMTAHLTFEGPECTNLVAGMYWDTRSHFGHKFIQFLGKIGQMTTHSWEWRPPTRESCIRHWPVAPWQVISPVKTGFSSVF